MCLMRIVRNVAYMAHRLPFGGSGVHSEAGVASTSNEEDPRGGA